MNKRKSILFAYIIIIEIIGLCICDLLIFQKATNHMGKIENSIQNANSILGELNSELKNQRDLPLLDIDADLYIDSDAIVVKLILNDINSMLSINREPIFSTYEIACNAFVDFSTGVIGIYKGHIPGGGREEGNCCRKSN